MSENVVALSGSTVEGLSVRQQILNSVAETAGEFERGGTIPTAAVYVLMDDEGGYRVGWDSRRSSLPGTAVLGMAIRALTNVRT